MPGKVIALLAKPGAAVDKGAPLLVLEAMKMEHTISAPRAGTVKAFRYAAGDQVAEGAELVEFEVTGGGIHRRARSFDVQTKVSLPTFIRNPRWSNLSWP